MLEDRAAPGTLAHPRNIEIGRARVIWAPWTVDVSGQHHASGWVFPGGRRTMNETEARAVAVAIDQLLGGAE